MTADSQQPIILPRGWTSTFPIPPQGGSGTAPPTKPVDIPTAEWARAESSRNGFDDAVDAIAASIHHQIRDCRRGLQMTVPNKYHDHREQLFELLLRLGYEVDWPVGGRLTIKW